MDGRFWGTELSPLLKSRGLKSLAPGVLRFFFREQKSQNLPDTESHCRLSLAPLHDAGPEQPQDCYRALQKGNDRTWKKRIMFHISPRTKEGLPSAISAASMLTSFTCREATDELSGVATYEENRWFSDALMGLFLCHLPCSALPRPPLRAQQAEVCGGVFNHHLHRTYPADTRLSSLKYHLSSPHTNPSM